MSISYVIVALVIGVCGEGIFDANNSLDLLAPTKGEPPVGVGYLPIEEIIRKTNMTNEQFVTTTMKQPESKRNHTKSGYKKRPATIKILMGGSDVQISNISYEAIMKNLHMIDKVNLPTRKKMLVWNTIKSHMPIQNMTKSHLKRLKNLLYDLPENDLVLINVTDWDIVKYLGVSKIISRRQAAIVGYAMKRKWGANIVEKPYFINKMKGLICAFSETDLRKISPAVFTKIEKAVFVNLWSCTEQQLRTLLGIALKPHAYGPLAVWNNQTVARMGLLLTLLHPTDFKQLNSHAFEGLNYTTVELMSAQQMGQFSQEQIDHLNEKALMSFREKFVVASKPNGAVSVKALDINVIILIMFIMRNL